MGTYQVTEIDTGRTLVVEAPDVATAWEAARQAGRITDETEMTLDPDLADYIVRRTDPAGIDESMYLLRLDHPA